MEGCPSEDQVHFSSWNSSLCFLPASGEKKVEGKDFPRSTGDSFSALWTELCTPFIVQHVKTKIQSPVPRNYRLLVGGIKSRRVSLGLVPPTIVVCVIDLYQESPGASDQNRATCWKMFLLFRTKW